jgi:HK97 family phage major capsid protein
MGLYLDRLNQQRDEIMGGINALVNRAAEENRDVTDDEEKQVERDRGKLSDLDEAIEHYTKLETDTEKVEALRSQVRPAPKVTRAAPEEKAPEYQVTDDFPTVGEYAVNLHRAMVHKDPVAREKLDRATAHQLLADNPGIVPKPVVGPLLNLIDSSRPFIQSVTTRPLPAGKFDRPYIDQHVAVAEQAAEKTLTASQKLLISSLEVTAKTFAGHLNISRQDIRWTNPGILQIVYDDFAQVYAITTCDYASDQFVTSVAGNTPIDVATADLAGITGALYEGAVAGLQAGAGHPDTLWVSPDVWGALGGAQNGQGGAAFPSLSVTGNGGNPLGLRLVVDSHFAAGTMISGPSRLVEWYEDVDGLMQVGEPDVLGQLVGYAGYGAFVNVDPTAFSRYTVPPVVP